jgi:hypothetical protein
VPPPGRHPLRRREEVAGLLGQLAPARLERSDVLDRLDAQPRAAAGGAAGAACRLVRGPYDSPIVDKRPPAYGAPAGWRRRILTLAAVFLPIFPALVAAAPATASTYYLSGSGSDRNPGTACRPWRTIRHADRVVSAGDNVHIRGGNYGARGVRATIASVGTAARPISWIRDPGAARPVFRGQLRVSGDHNRISGILFQGPSGSIRGADEDVLVWLDADGVELEHSEVRDGGGHAGIFVSDSRNFAIRNDYVHRNGDSFNLDQGIYVDSGSGQIQNNLIASNYAWGVQLYPRSEGVTVNHNTIVGNGRGGVIVAADATHSLLANNIVASNGEYGIYAYDLSGAGNVAANNLLWDQPLNASGAGIRFGADLVADPRFVGGSSFQIDAASPAVDAGAAPAVADDLAGARRLGRADLGAYEYGSPVPADTPVAVDGCR